MRRVIAPLSSSLRWSHNIDFNPSLLRRGRSFKTWRLFPWSSHRSEPLQTRGKTFTVFLWSVVCLFSKFLSAAFRGESERNQKSGDFTSERNLWGFIHRNFRVGRRGLEFSCLFRFSSGNIIASKIRFKVSGIISPVSGPRSGVLTTRIWGVRLGSKVGQIEPNGTNSGFFF